MNNAKSMGIEKNTTQYMCTYIKLTQVQSGQLVFAMRFPDMKIKNGAEV